MTPRWGPGKVLWVLAVTQVAPSRQRVLELPAGDQPEDVRGVEQDGDALRLGRLGRAAAAAPGRGRGSCPARSAAATPAR